MAKKIKKANDRSWMSLQSEVQPSSQRKVPLARRMRRIWRGFLAAVVLALIGGAIYGVFLGLKVDWTSEPVEVQVMLKTNGTLNEAWLVEVLDLPTRMDLRKVNLSELGRKIRAQGQVRNARVARELSVNQLHFEIREHVPLAKAIGQTREGTRVLLVVSREGAVYEGVNYPLRFYGELPTISGVVLRRESEGYADIPGVDRVYQLWKAAGTYPSLRSEWRRIILDEYFPEREPFTGVIKVQTTGNMTIIFTPRDYSSQLRVLYFTQNQVPATSGATIDLTQGGQAVVEPAN